jgi:hypothetical protein
MTRKVVGIVHVFIAPLQQQIGKTVVNPPVLFISFVQVEKLACINPHLLPEFQDDKKVRSEIGYSPEDICRFSL